MAVEGLRVMCYIWTHTRTLGDGLGVAGQDGNVVTRHLESQEMAL